MKKNLLAFLSVLIISIAGCDSEGGESAANDTIPSSPTGVTAVKANSQVTITWAEVSGAVSYNIYWSTNAGVTTSTGTKVAGATKPYVHSGLTNNNPYYYVVTAVNSAGESTISSEVSATPVAATSKPSAPGDVTATAVNGEVVIHWTLVDGAQSYNIYYSTSPDVSLANFEVVINGATEGCSITGLTHGTTYYFVVYAVNSHGESIASEVVSATP
ncbi:MAG TPA: fibronectin type III domain-containing protein [Spirochaetota bacterium]|mgnify:CR=1 FL=1|nr:fibronectin type III domain-containing protein [Spirochaetota bacterium]